MNGRFFIVAIVFIFSFINGNASFNDSLITGTWKGTSICQVKDSPCHDEIAICHVNLTDRPGVYQFVMNKMVNGIEEEMGTADYIFNGKEKSLTWVDKTRNSIWTFYVDSKSKTMEGTLYYKRQLYRVIKLTKEK